jgi:RND family efflux transporter MFP subunit
VVGEIAMYGLTNPDIPTSLQYMKPVSDALVKLQAMIESGTIDSTEMSRLLIMAQHDLDMTGVTLENELMYFENGVSLQAMAQYNLNLKTANIALQNAKDELKKTEILAPFDGEIVDVNVKEYDQLSVYDYASITAVHLVDTSEVQLKGVVDEIDIFQVKVGQQAVVTVDSLPGELFKGKVTFIAPVASKGTAVVEFPVNIMLDKTDVELKGGLTATANLVVEKHENVLIIPIRALKGSVGNYRVDVLVDAATGKYESRTVTTGIQNDRSIEIISGLKEGEQVIIGTPTTSR